MDARTALIDLHDRLVESYNANPTEQGRELIAICEIALNDRPEKIYAWVEPWTIDEHSEKGK